MEPAMDDLELLREFATTNSEQVFARLVARYSDLVHLAALRQEQLGIAKMNYLKTWMGAITQYALDKSTNDPSDFEDAMPYMPPQIRDKFSQDQFQIVFKGNLKTLTNPERTIVIAEKHPTRTSSGNWVRAYGFADGHFEIHSAPTQEGFAGCEKERLITTVSSQ